MTQQRLRILVVGATGSIGRHVVAEALARGHAVRALVRDTRKGRMLGDAIDLAIGDLTEKAGLDMAVEGADAIIFTHGSNGGGKLGSERVDYGGVRNLLTALGPRKVRIALMTAIGVTNRTGSYNRSTEAHDWKRRAERLVRASGHAYTIVRPGWFDYNDTDQEKLVLLQGDERQSGTPQDGVISRRQIAQVLVASLTCDAARNKTFELVAETGPAQGDLEPLFSTLAADAPDGLDAIRDAANMPMDEEPDRILDDLAALRRQSFATAS
ncbi:Uncharacterized conserved protein YbjT, contains NAD(P)-binding and DUF2867 domains [Rhizobium sp. NFR07]|uniref:SDR family oxidoreductase n=1 Tax=Rhizobium sp. NFR07 TaxID=1566262 RepID=UPI0008EA0642|nr:SDR family oxidoreductase [Rhizobium sp. NFR07]SFB09150.1 Uncharacterized conserved protein YbjT, contains NAD(P)-binding and DUF2867 domains [Rhizobium sp. NFR07]